MMNATISSEQGRIVLAPKKRKTAAASCVPAQESAHKRAKRLGSEHRVFRHSLATLGDGLEVRVSSIPGAGQGVFATRYFAAGSPVTEYQGDLVTFAAAKAMTREERSHVRALQLNRTAIDGKRVAALALDGSGAGALTNHACAATANVEFAHVDSVRYQAEFDQWRRVMSAPFPDPTGRLLFMRATRDIAPGDELLADYGEDYWRDC